MTNRARPRHDVGVGTAYRMVVDSSHAAHRIQLATPVDFGPRARAARDDPKTRALLRQPDTGRELHLSDDGVRWPTRSPDDGGPSKRQIELSAPRRHLISDPSNSVDTATGGRLLRSEKATRTETRIPSARPTGCRSCRRRRTRTSHPATTATRPPCGIRRERSSEPTATRSRSTATRPAPTGRTSDSAG